MGLCDSPSCSRTALASGVVSLSVLRLTSELHDWPLFRITVEPDAVPKSKIGQKIGSIDDASMQAVSVAFACFPSPR